MLALERTTHLLTFGIFVCVNIGLRAAANDEAKGIVLAKCVGRYMYFIVHTYFL